jgi:hypothetical protein
VAVDAPGIAGDAVEDGPDFGADVAVNVPDIGRGAVVDETDIVADAARWADGSGSGAGQKRAA